MSQQALGERAVRIAVVGSGPSGFYAIAALFKQQSRSVEADLFDRLPTPFGLVRGGVAPDHQNIKAVVRIYDKLAAQDNFRFFGNVEIGRDLTVEELATHYDVIVYATGNESERRLGIPGEDLPGVHSATEFVGWYNGHPSHRDCHFDLEGSERALVIGNGNVAMDVTRILAKDPEELAGSDIAEHALEELRKSNIREILILGRRGPAQAAFTPKEIKEIGSLESADLIVDPDSMVLDDVTLHWLEANPSSKARKNVDYLTEKSRQSATDADRRIRLNMLVSPVEFIATNGRLGSVRLEGNSLYKSDDGTPRPRGTGETSVEEAQIAFTAVGYRGIPIPGVPFDGERGVLANRQGRIVDPQSGEVQSGHYAVGWAKRGPQGLIGSNVADANETVALILEDLANDRLGAAQQPGREAIDELLGGRGIQVVSFTDWQRLDTMEIERGQERGKIREKFTRVEEMLAALR